MLIDKKEIKPLVFSFRNVSAYCKGMFFNMISSIYLTGEAGPIINSNMRYLKVTRPVPNYGTREYEVDSFIIVVKNPPGTQSQFMKIPEGALAIIQGRLESYPEGNKLLIEHGLPAGCVIVVAEITECYTLSENMAGYQEFILGQPSKK